MAKSSFCRGIKRISDTSPEVQNDPATLEVLVGVDGTVTGGEIGMFAEDREEETVPPPVVKEVMGMEVEEGGGAVVELTEVPSGLEYDTSPPLRHRPRGETTSGG